MSKFIVIAQEAIKTYETGDIDSHLQKIASAHSLNSEEHQRLVEEYNIGSFLNKLQEGTQHEEYPVASPVVSVANIEGGGGSTMQKTASSVPAYTIHEHMFIVSSDEDDCSNSMEKTASSPENEELFTSEAKWDRVDQAREVEAEEETAMIKVAEEKEKLMGLTQELLKLSSSSEGMTKTAILGVHQVGFKTEAESMLENSRFSTDDIASSTMEPLCDSGSKILFHIAAHNG